MGGYAIRRGVDGLVTIWMVTLLIFLLLRVTGNPIDILVPPDTLLEDRERLKILYGLDKPVWQQYLTFVKGVFVGNFGVSLRWADPVCSQLCQPHRRRGDHRDHVHLAGDWQLGGGLCPGAGLRRGANHRVL
jgi:ABC-type dipeptide/oligopeptide/nickel transport system permease component